MFTSQFMIIIINEIFWISLIIVVAFVQIRIVYFKWQILNDPQLPPQDQNENDHYDWTKITFGCIVLLVIGFLAMFALTTNVLVIGQLLILLIAFIFTFAIIVSIIKSNERMFSYVLKQLTPNSLTNNVHQANVQSPYHSSQADISNNSSNIDEEQDQNPFVIPQPLHNPPINVRRSTDTNMGVFSISAQISERRQTNTLPDVYV